MSSSTPGISRRKLFERAAGAAALGSTFRFVEQPAGAQRPETRPVNRNSAPSQLRITDMRAIRIASNFDYRLSAWIPTRACTDWAKRATPATRAWR